MSEVSTHTFRGRTMQEAVGRLKATLGPDAVIVGTRRGRDHRGQFVEIDATGTESKPNLSSPGTTAAPGVAEPPAMGGRRGASAAYARTAQIAPSATPDPSLPFAERAAWLARQVALRQAPALPAPPIAPGSPVDDDTIADLRAQLGELQGAVGALAQLAEAPRADNGPLLRAELGALQAELHGLRELMLDRAEASFEAVEAPMVSALRARLTSVGVAPTHADELARRTHKAVPDGTADDGDVLAMLGRAMADELACTGPLSPRSGHQRVIAFVGPTGVGKTTTLAKVAARARILDGASVALVTVDTFRMAAVDQLARYADILECPLEVVKRPDDLGAALDRLADYDLVLVDTTGRNPRAEDQVNALARFFPAGWGGEIVLTVACSTREADVFATIDAFARLRVDMLCVTKTDETNALGTLYSAVRRAARPLAWVTDGQRVPEDIEVAEPTALAARIVGRAAAEGLQLAG